MTVGHLFNASSDQLENLEQLTDPGEVVLWAKFDDLDVPTEVLLIRDTGVLATLHNRIEVDGQFWFTDTQTESPLSKADTGALYADIPANVGFNPEYPLSNLVLGRFGAKVETVKVLSAATGAVVDQVSAPPIIETPSSPASAPAADPVSVEISRAASVASAPANVAPVEAPVTAPPVPVDGDVSLTGGIRTASLGYGDEDDRAASIQDFSPFIQRLEVRESGDLTVSIGHWGGAPVIARLVRDLDNDGVATAGEDLVFLERPGPGTASAVFEDASYGTYYLVVQTTGQSGKSAEIKTSVSLDETAAPSPAPVDTIPEVPVGPQDFVTANDPGSIGVDTGPLRGHLEFSGDVDDYVSDVLEAGNLYDIYLASVTGETFRIRFYDNNNDFLGALSTGPDGFTVLRLEIPDDPTALNSGRYRFEVDSPDAATGSFALRIEDRGEIPTVDDVPDDAPLDGVLGAEQPFVVAGPDDEDGVTFHLNAGHNYAVFVDAFATDIAPLTHTVVKVFAQGGALVAEKYSDRGDMGFNFVAPSSGEYTVVLSSTNGGSGQASVRVTDNGLGAVPPALPSSSVHQGALLADHAYDDEDLQQAASLPVQGHVYDLNVAANAAFSVYVSEASNQFGSVDINLFQDGVLVVPDARGNYPDDGEFIAYRTPADHSGTLQVVVSHTNPFNTAFQYKIDAQIDDDRSNTPDGAESLSMSTPALVHVTRGTDDFLDVSSLSGPVSFSFSGSSNPDWPTPGALLARIVDANGRSLVEDRIFDLVNDRFEVTLDDGGQDQYLQLSRYGSSGAVNVTASRADDDLPGDETTLASISPGQTVTGRQETFGDADAFSFTLFSGATLGLSRLQLEGFQGGHALRIVDVASGGSLFETTQLNDTWVVGDLGAPAIEALLVIDHSTGNGPDADNYIGDYQITLTDLTPDDHAGTHADAFELALDTPHIVTLETADDIDLLALPVLPEGAAALVSLTASGQLPLENAVLGLQTAAGTTIQSQLTADDGSLTLRYISTGAPVFLAVSSLGGQDRGSAEIVVTGVNAAPAIWASGGQVAQGDNLEVSALVQAADPDGDALTHWTWRNLDPDLGRLVDSEGRALGVQAVLSENNLYFDATAGATGTARLLVQVSDSVLQSAWQQVTVDISAASLPISGTSGDDQIYGTSGDNLIKAFDGHDTIHATAGDDTVRGGSGDDVIIYAGALRDYTVSKDADGSVSVVSLHDGDIGTDRLESVEELRFADGVFDSDSASSTRIEDNGDRVISTYDTAGHLASQVIEDLSGTQSWSRSTTLFDDTGRQVSRSFAYDDGSMAENTFVNGLRSSNVVTRANGDTSTTTFGPDGVRETLLFEDKSGTQVWTSYTNHYDDAGNRVNKSFVFDNGNVAVDTYENGLRTLGVVTEADGDVRTSAYGADGILDSFAFEDLSNGRNWTNYINRYDDQGLRESKSVLYDNGNTGENTYDAGQRTLSVLTEVDGDVSTTTFGSDGVRDTLVFEDLSETYNWASFTNEYDDAGVRVAKTILYDNGNSTRNTFENGQRTQSVITEPDGDVSTTDFGADGVRDTFVFEDLSETRDWLRYTNLYDDAGLRVSKTTVFDDGRETVATYENGVLVSTTVTTPQPEPQAGVLDDLGF